MLKRLHMRKKRAAASGADVDLTAGRLTPGRKPKGSTTPTTNTPVKAARGQDEGREDADPAQPSHTSGKTMPYKVREKLGSLGIDVEWMQQEGLDFFHLGNISKLMRYGHTCFLRAHVH